MEVFLDVILINDFLSGRWCSILLSPMTFAILEAERKVRGWEKGRRLHKIVEIEFEEYRLSVYLDYELRKLYESISHIVNLFRSYGAGQWVDVWTEPL